MSLEGDLDFIAAPYRSGFTAGVEPAELKVEWAYQHHMPHLAKNL
jgi:hypothetical protein